MVAKAHGSDAILEYRSLHMGLSDGFSGFILHFNSLRGRISANEPSDAIIAISQERAERFRTAYISVIV